MAEIQYDSEKLTDNHDEKQNWMNKLNQTFCFLVTFISNVFIFGLHRLYVPAVFGVSREANMSMANVEMESQSEASIQGRGHVHCNGALRGA